VIKEASAQQAKEHCSRYPVNIDPSLLFAVDEMGVSERTNPLYGYSLANTRLVHKRTSGSWKNISTVAVIGCDGSVKSQLSEHSFNTRSFSSFLAGLDLPSGSHVILDNVAFHRSKAVADVFASRGWTPLFIPPYQPDFNPIENVFSSVKHRIRRAVGRGQPVRRAITHSFQDASLPTTIKNCFRHMHDLVRHVRRPLLKEDRLQ
jgi:transposase